MVLCINDRYEGRKSIMAKFGEENKLFKGPCKVVLENGLMVDGEVFAVVEESKDGGFVETGEKMVMHCGRFDNCKAKLYIQEYI